MKNERIYELALTQAIREYREVVELAKAIAGSDYLHEKQQQIYSEILELSRALDKEVFG